MTQALIVSLRFTRLMLAWVGLIFWSSACFLVGVVLPRAAWFRIPQIWGRLSCRLLGVHCHVEHQERLTPGALFAQNHDSFSDVFTTPAVLPRGTKFVAKKELSRIPFFGWGARVGVVFIDRAKGNSAVKTISTGLDTLPQDWSMFIFPEGTRSLDGELGRFKKGVVHMALESRRPIVPIGSYGGAGIVPPKAWLIRSGPIEFTVGAPIDTTHWTAENVSAQLEEIRVAIVDLQAQSRRRYEAQHGALDTAGADTLVHELRGLR